MKYLMALCLLLSAQISMAETYLQINGASWHDRPGYNSVNYGLGIEHELSEHWSVAGGWYRNSEYLGSTYAYGRYAFYKQDQWNLGIAVGAVTGYRRASVIPMAFPEACYAWACALFAPRVEPTGANVVGFRLRIPID
jgi:hypothetical protein